MGENITPRMICARGIAPVLGSACFGDSGGPLSVYRPKSKTFSLVIKNQKQKRIHIEKLLCINNYL